MKALTESDVDITDRGESRHKTPSQPSTELINSQIQKYREDGSFWLPVQYNTIQEEYLIQTPKLMIQFHPFFMYDMIKHVMCRSSPSH